MNSLRLAKFKIECWDSGWWQARTALADRDLGADDLGKLKSAHEALREKLLASIGELGFLG